VGANVTLPHKLAAASLCDSLSPLSQKLGTVNTLYFRDNALVGTTTDPEGFLRALARMGHDVHGGTMVILGNGGTARTLAAALALEHIPKKITLAGRSTERVSALAAEISSVSGSKIHSVGLAGPALRDAIDECTLLVNCTSAGMYPNVNETPLDKSFLHAGLTVFDTVYNPEKTRLLREAEAAGCKVQNGLRMLLYQAIASLTLWTGVDILEDIFDLDELQKSLLK
jgi:shikimate dehydrogenase